MLLPNDLQIIRKPEVLHRTSFSRSSLHEKIRQELFVPPISLGDRAVGWVKSEVNEVLAAMIAGEPREEIISLVKGLVARRQRPAEQADGHNRF